MCRPEKEKKEASYELRCRGNAVTECLEQERQQNIYMYIYVYMFCICMFQSNWFSRNISKSHTKQS